MKRFRIAIIFIVILIGGFFLFIYSGIYNISALEPHNSLTLWLVNILTDNSIEHQAKEIKVPALSDPALIKTGFIHYREMCVGCHGAPGIEQNEMAEGLYPKPPELVEL